MLTKNKNLQFEEAELKLINRAASKDKRSANSLIRKGSTDYAHKILGDTDEQKKDN